LKFSKFSIFLLVLFSAFFSNSLNNATASERYSRKNGVAGEFKYIKVCSYDYYYSVSGVMEASQEGPAKVIAVKINQQNKVWYSPTPNGWALPIWTSKVNWRPVETVWNWKGGNPRFYDFSYNSSYGTLLAFDTEVKLGSIITLGKGQGRIYDVFDLGGIINLGMIQRGSCKVYEDGVFK
jgi:hypothetical protein